MASAPQISVVIPCHNAALWVADTLESVRAQHEVSFEIVMVDDGSTDDSVAIVAKAGVGLPIRVIRQSQRGVSVARAAGTALAIAPFIQYLDSDDLLSPGTLQSRLSALIEHDADVAYCDFAHLERGPDNVFHDTIQRARILGDRPEVELLTDAWWPPGALLYRRSIVERLAWREDLPVIQDARFLFDAALTGGAFVHVPGVGLRYRVHGNGSLSRRDPMAFLDDCLRNMQEIHAHWTDAGALDDDRRRALAKGFAFLTRSFFALDKTRHAESLARLLAVQPNFLPDGPADFRVLTRVVGFERAEHIAAWSRPLKRAVFRLLERTD